MLSCLDACITSWLCFQPVAQQVLYRHPLLPSLSWLLVMPECVWLKACASVSGNALLMGPAIRQPSPLSQRKTRWKHAACQWLIKEWSSVYSTAERNSKSLCSPRALSGGSPALLNAPVTVLHTLLALCVFVLRSNGGRRPIFTFMLYETAKKCELYPCNDEKVYTECVNAGTCGNVWIKIHFLYYIWQ